MRRTLVIVFSIVLLVSMARCAPADQSNVSSDAKSAFGVAFDEIVVDTSLTVKRKDASRQSRSQNAPQGAVAASIVPQKKNGNN